jgi:PAS domain S-box-containing protein
MHLRNDKRTAAQDGEAHMLQANRPTAHSAAILRSLPTMMGWRRTPAALVDADNGTVVACNPNGAALNDSMALLGALSPSTRRDSIVASKPFVYGDLSLRLVESSDRIGDLECGIPSWVMESALRTIVEANFAVWYVWHVESGACWVPGLMELLGLSAEEVPTTIEEWCSFAHPEDLPRLVEDNDAAIRGERPMRSEFRVRHASGQYIWIRDYSVVLRDGTGQSTWMAGGQHDIRTERALEESRRETSKLYEALFHQANVPTLLVDGKGTFVDANKAAFDFFELARSALIGHPFAAVLPANLANEVELAINRPDGQSSVYASREVPFDVCGVTKWLRVAIIPLETSAGTMIFVRGPDLTEEKRVSLELKRSEQSLRQKTQALEDRNIALRVLADRQHEELDQVLRSVNDNIQQLAMPILNHIERTMRDRPEVALVEAARLTLTEIARPLIRPLTDPRDNPGHLSRREYEVLQLIRTGKTTDEIAGLLCLSSATVAFHRSNIRRKLGLSGTGRHLASEVRIDQLPR